jgi:hypothetical protein
VVGGGKGVYTVIGADVANPDEFVAITERVYLEFGFKLDIV